ncbi:MAG TPA: DUF4156 domain-containing protein [Burkholderiaceae bacterium]|jgi:hypothetical protein
MQISKAMLVITAITVATALSACSNALIDQRVGAELVTVADANQVANCQSKGNVTINVLSKIGFINRSSDNVEANLLKMARNEAIDAHGDTIVKGERADVGTQTFAIYKCH